MRNEKLEIRIWFWLKDKVMCAPSKTLPWGCLHPGGNWWIFGEDSFAIFVRHLRFYRKTDEGDLVRYDPHPSHLRCDTFSQEKVWVVSNITLFSNRENLRIPKKGRIFSSLSVFLISAIRVP